MKPEKKLKEYKDNLTPPSKEDVLPPYAIKKERKRSISYKRLAAVTISACLLLASALAVPSLFREGGLLNSEEKITGGLYPLKNSPTIFINGRETGEFVEGEPKTYYYLPISGNSFEISIEEYIKEKSNPFDIGNTFFNKTGKNGTGIKSFKINKTEAKEEISGGIVTYTPSVTTVTLYIEGNETIDELTYKCLVNTIASNLNCEYVILYHNNEKVKIGGKSPNMGFELFRNLKDINEKEPPEWAENWEEMVDLSIKVVDKNGAPVKGVYVSLEYLSGEYGAYESGSALTDENGTTKRQAHPNAVYNLYVQQRNCVSYTSKIKSYILYEFKKEISVTKAEEITVTIDETNFIKKTDVINTLKFKVVDKKGNPVSDLSVELYTLSSVSGQAQLGFTDKKGEIAWHNFTKNKYTIMIRQKDKDNPELYKTTSFYSVEVDENSDVFTLVWTGKSSPMNFLVLE